MIFLQSAKTGLSSARTKKSQNFATFSSLATGYLRFLPKKGSKIRLISQAAKCDHVRSATFGKPLFAKKAPSQYKKVPFWHFFDTFSARARKTAIGF